VYDEFHTIGSNAALSFTSTLTSRFPPTYDPHTKELGRRETGMKKVTTGAIAALLASTAMASAGGIDRSGQSVGILFEEGTYVEFSYGYVDPAVSGVDPAVLDTGDLAPVYSLMSGGFKTDINDKISAAVIFDQPFGSSADYSSGFYTGTAADLSTSAVTLLVSYDVSDNIVVYGGGSAQSMAATAAIPFVAGYDIDASSDTGFGYVVGAAYQIPEIALRVGLTYRSEISTTHDTLEYGAIDGTVDVTTPQSLNLDFQTGVNEKTLVFGSIRWVEWSNFDLTPDNYPLGSVLDYDNDVITYSLGVGRKLTDNLSGAVTVGYEAATGGDPTPLAPTDGYMSVGAGLTYAFDNVEITGGVKYLWLGDASGAAGTFEGNNAMAFGLKVAFSL
jgi:long-subunit fatty acid transport protein